MRRLKRADEQRVERRTAPTASGSSVNSEPGCRHRTAVATDPITDHVGTDAEEGRMAQAHQPRHADQQFQAERKHREDEDLHHQVAVCRASAPAAAAPAQQQTRASAMPGARPPEAGRRPGDPEGPLQGPGAGASATGGPQYPRFIRPSRAPHQHHRHQQVDPDARLSSAKNTLPKVSTTPTSSEAISAPLIEPMPPITTTTKQTIRMLRAHARIDASSSVRRSCRPARPAPRRRRRPMRYRQRDVDAQPAHHLAVAGPGADHHTQPGAC